MKRKSIWLLWIAVILFCSLLLLLEFSFAQYIDDYGENIQKLFAHPSFKYIFLIITNFMSVLGIVIIFVSTAILLRKQKAKKEIILYIITVVVGFLLTNFIKVMIKRDRPANMLLDVSGYSFPSSHSSVSMIVYGYLVLLIRKYYHGKRKSLYIFLCCLCILLTGLSRVYFNVHYITDVFAGFSVGLMILCISYLVMKKFDKSPKK